MRLHYLAGDRAAALQAFDRCERVLKDELSTLPDAQTRSFSHRSRRARSSGRPERGAAATVLRPPVLVGVMRKWRQCTRHGTATRRSS